MLRNQSTAVRQDAFAVSTITKDNVSYGSDRDNIVHSLIHTNNHNNTIINKVLLWLYHSYTYFDDNLSLQTQLFHIGLVVPI